MPVRPYQLRVSKATTPQMLQQNAAVPRRKTHLEPLRRLTIKAPLAQELPRRDGVGGGQLFGEELSGQPECLGHADSHTGLRSCAGIVGVAQLNAHAISQPLDRLDKSEVVDLAHEIDHVTALGAGAEAVLVAAGGCHLETRGLLIMEGAQTLHGPARAAEGDVGADYFLDSSSVAYGGDVFLIDPPTHGRESMFLS